ncbi:MAG: hypothetical protein LAO76_19385 [Acidobacteriia bacterium]|nr:hypothetical protein [Terriglobia bacterium]
MSFSSTGSTKPMLSLERLQELYDRNQFLDAYQLSSEYWKPSTRLEDLSTAELVLGGRLASRLGSSQLSRRLFKEAFRRDPSDPSAIYYSSYIERRGKALFDVLRKFESNPEIPGANDEIQASMFAYHAVLAGTVRDFDRAHQYLKRAHSYKTRDGWVFSCEADVLGFEDRWPEALQSAEQAWRVSPGTPFAARGLATSLLNLRRAQELRRFWRKLRRAASLMKMRCWPAGISALPLKPTPAKSAGSY